MAVKSDLELWQEILADKTTAWGELVKRYQPLVYTVAIRAGLSLSDAGDCFQQTWVLLYQHRQKLKDPSRLAAWLVTTAKREALRLRRRAGPDPGDTMDSREIDPNPLADDELIQLERQAELETALQALDKRCRDLLTAFFFAPDELSYAQIAKQMGMAVNSLGPIRQRCLGRLKEILEARGFDCTEK